MSLKEDCEKAAEETRATNEANWKKDHPVRCPDCMAVLEVVKDESPHGIKLNFVRHES